ncbi:MAG: hypothetical protein ABSB99_10515 [Acidimicrobiales bacterium]
MTLRVAHTFLPATSAASEAHELGTTTRGAESEAASGTIPGTDRNEPSKPSSPTNAKSSTHSGAS